MHGQVAECDVLIIGAGGAGLRAAIEAHDNGASVLVVTKTLLGKAHTVMAEGGINAALGNVDVQDSWQAHFKDTMTEGQMLSDYRMAEILVKEAPERILELERWGAVFDRTADGKIDQRFFGAHTYRRACHTGDRIGLEILRTLQDQVTCRNIRIMQETVVTSLLEDSGTVSGVAAVHVPTGEFFVIKCKSIILTTGGCGRLFKVTTNSLEATGDGYALALKAGAELQDMEMIQFHPTGMVYPESARGMLVTEGVRAEGGILTNANGYRFMKDYDQKRMELSARDVVARAIFMEIEKGNGTKHGGVYLDITHRDRDYILKKLPRMHDQFLAYADVDIAEEKMEVAPSAHYTMGGIRVNPENQMSSVKGLFAAGEAAAGVHGANRLGGNSLIDIMVFGRRAGLYAAEYSKKSKPNKINKAHAEGEYRRVRSFFKAKDGVRPQSLRSGLQEIMAAHAEIVRNGKDLKKALEDVLRLRNHVADISVHGSVKYNPEWVAALETVSMLLVAECVIRSALFRQESRGAHFRSDYPGKDDKNWLVNIVCALDNGRVRLSVRGVPGLREDLKRLAETDDE